MSTALLRSGQLLRSRLAASLLTPQQARSQSVFSEITSKLKQQVESNPELKEQLNKFKQGAEDLHKQGTAAAQQAQEVLREAAAQNFGTPRSAPGGEAAKDAANGSGGDASAGASVGREGSDSQQQQEAGAAGGGGGQAGAGAGAAGQQAKANFVHRGRGVLSMVWSEVSQAISPTAETVSATRRRDESLRQPEEAGGGPSAVMVVEQPESLWKKRWNAFAGRYADHPLFKRFRSVGGAAAVRGREAADDLRERWETSDSPLVHRVQDMSDSVFTETEMARAYREINQRDPNFDMPRFLSQVRADVPTVVRAYLMGDTAALKEHCAPEMTERLTAIIAAQQAQGLVSDPTLLDTSDVELVEIKLLESDPVVVLRFNCQQINCSRDKFGNVTDGAPDDVQRVYYLWALQQDRTGFASTGGKHYPPRWQLKEMMIHGMVPLVG